MRIVLGVSGGIAAYKACSLLRLFTEAGHDVTVVPTAVGAAVRRRPHLGGAVRQARAHRGLGRPSTRCPHVRLGQSADLVVVAPATADLLAKAAHGLADDLLTNVLLTARCPVVMAPAMHTEMWDHPATQANVVHPHRARRARRSRPRRGGSPAPTPARAGCPSPRSCMPCASGSSPTAAPRGRPQSGLGGIPHGAAQRRPSLAGRTRRRHGRRHPRAARPGALPREPQLGQAGLRPRRASRPDAAPTVTLVAANTALPAPPA